MSDVKNLGISVECHGIGSRETPKSLLKKLNNELNNNAEQNSDYYAVPKIKRINESVNSQEADGQSVSVIDKSILETLTDEQRAVLNELPCDKPVSVDALTKNGYSIGTLMATLTILEIKGLVSSLPGGLYIRK